MRLGGNEYNRSEAAGAFGDLGTLVPFVVGYITINRLDPQAVLLGFGLVAISTGLYFRTPMPVQPMKAIATVAVTHPETVTPGLFWLGMGASGAVSWLAALTRRPVVRGMVLGLAARGENHCGRPVAASANRGSPTRPRDREPAKLGARVVRSVATSQPTTSESAKHPRRRP